MKYLNEIPPYFKDYDKRGLLVDSESITYNDLLQIDEQVSPYNLEIVWFENGAAINWTVQLK